LGHSIIILNAIQLFAQRPLSPPAAY